MGGETERIRTDRVEEILRRTTGRRDLLKGALAAGLVAAGGGILSACGGAATSTPEGTSAAAATSTQSGSSSTTGEKVNLTFWASPLSEDEQKKRDTQTAKFQSKFPNVTVQLSITPWESWDAAYSTAFAGSNPPDVHYTIDTTYPKYAAAGHLLDLTELTNDPSYATEKAAYVERFWKLGQWDGKQWGIPSIASAWPIYYNLDLMAKQGINKIPETYDEMTKMAVACTVPNETWGMGMWSKEVDWAFDAWLWAFHNNGAYLVTDDKKKAAINTQGGKAALQFIVDLYSKYKAIPPHGAYDRTGIKDLFKGGKIAAHIEEPVLMADLQANDPGFKWDMALPPAGSAKRTTYADAGFYAIANLTKHKAEAWELVKFLTSAEEDKWYWEPIGYPLPRTDIEAYQGNEMAAKIKGFVNSVDGNQIYPQEMEVYSKFWQECEAAIIGDKTVDQAIADAEKSINTVLSK